MNQSPAFCCSGSSYRKDKMPPKKVARTVNDETKKPTLVRVTEQRLTPAEFKAEVGRKGWTYRALAQRWGVTESWMSKLAHKEDRPMHWDDAVRGLPMVIRR
jgi:hypothetical protein